MEYSVDIGNDEPFRFAEQGVLIGAIVAVALGILVQTWGLVSPKKK